MLALYLRIRNLLTREEGQDLIEYALLLGLLVVALVAVLPGIGDWVLTQFSDLSTALTNSGT